MHTSERRLGSLRVRSRASARSDRANRVDSHEARQAAFPTSRAVRRLLVSVAGISVVTLVLAVQALPVRPITHEAAAPMTALILVPVLWLCSAGVYRSRQRSMLAYAQTWATKMRDEALRQRIATDGHAPGMYRALTVRNLEPWYQAFNVQEGQRLYLAPEQRVRVW